MLTFSKTRQINQLRSTHPFEGSALIFISEFMIKPLLQPNGW